MMDPEVVPSDLILTTDLPKFGGRIRETPEDFQVDEIPAYAPCGEGTHLYLHIEKRGLTTPAAITALAQALKVRVRDIGYAGQKDSNAVTRQWLSVEHLDPRALGRINRSDLKILEWATHRNKLRIGHLKANRFLIRIRQLTVDPSTALERARRVLDVLQQRGLPNAYGPQRFGIRGDAHRVGRAICLDEPEACLDLMLGRPHPEDPDLFAQARRLYDEGRYPEALRSWPASFREERHLLKQLLICKGNKRAAFRRLHLPLRRFFVSAFQSHLFNQVLAARLRSLDRLLDGDIAFIHETGACFPVEWAAEEQARCDAFDISPTGPILGRRMTPPAEAAGELERPLVEAYAGPLVRDPERMHRSHLQGGRRPLRVQPQDVDCRTGRDDLGDFLELCFTLPSGSYATVLLQEILEPDPEVPLR